MMSVGTLQRLASLLLALSVIAATAGVLVWLSKRPMFDLKGIAVRGEARHVTESAVRAALAGTLSGNWFTVRLEDARRRLEALPWVATASVRRVWPDRLHVELVEHRALGVWNDGRLLSERGVLFAANPAEAEIDATLPEFSGPFSLAADAAQRYRVFDARLRPLGLSLVAIEVSDRSSWAVDVSTADGGATRIELGRDTAEAPLDDRLHALAAAYPIVIARLGAVPQRIDARYSNGFAIAPAPRR